MMNAQRAAVGARHAAKAVESAMSIPKTKTYRGYVECRMQTLISSHRDSVKEAARPARDVQVDASDVASF